jgi:peroxiredoxin
MIELGELEKRHEDFARRNVRVVVVSNDAPEIARLNQADLPHLIVVSDAQQAVAGSMQILHRGAGPQGTDTNAPATFLVDGNGVVRRLLQPNHFMTRYSPDQVLAAVDEVW